MNLPNKPFSFLLHFVRQQKGSFLLFILISITWAINDTAFPYFLKLMVNTLQNYTGPASGVFAAVQGVLIVLFVFWLVMESLQRVQGIAQIKTFPKFRANIRAEVFDYVKSHSQDFFASHFAGYIAKKLADLPQSCQNIVEIICFQFVPAGLGSLIVLIMMWQINPVFAFIVFFWILIHLGLTLLFLRSAVHLLETHADSVSVLSGKIVDVFTNILNVRLFARGKYEAEYLNQFQQEEINYAKKSMWRLEIMRIGLGLNGLFLIFGMVVTLLYGWSQHWVTLGDFTQVGMQSFWILGWIWHTSYQMTFLARELGTVSDALILVSRGHDLVDAKNAYPIVINPGQIEFAKVSFAYGRNKIFDQLDVIIPAGQKVGLVGFSGAGKTTFVNLILRFYDVQSGRILIDDQNIAEVTQDSLRAQIAMIPQEPLLFHRTLMENIRYGRLEASDAEVIAASKLAHCHEFIEKAENGYATLVGERGIRLSGGQRQRIAIARAILKNAPILILDEATSSLDSITEKLIHESLQSLMRGRTTLVVAHRLSTLADMDRILVFHGGKIIEEGTKESLLKAKGFFAELWSRQTDGFLPD